MQGINACGGITVLGTGWRPRTRKISRFLSSSRCYAKLLLLFLDAILLVILVLFLVGIGGWNLWNGTRMIMRGGDGKFSDGRAEFEVLS